MVSSEDDNSEAVTSKKASVFQQEQSVNHRLARHG